MRPIVLLLLLALLPMAWAQPGPDVRIAEVHPDPADGGREFIELWNAGDTAQDLTGWALSDAADTTYTFGAVILQPGARIVVWGGGEATPEGPAWSKPTVWNNGGDTVILSDGATVQDQLTYGSDPAAPAKGRSLSRTGTQWEETDPTPGRAPGAVGGSATAEVQDVPPTARVDGVPARIAPGQGLNVTLSVQDGNGPEGLTWTLWSMGQVVATGNQSQGLPLRAPQTGPWRLALSATDGTHTTWDNHTVEVLPDALAVVLPAGGLRFPPLEPGALGVRTQAPFTIRNDGARPLVPHLDLSDFRGPETLPVAGRLQVGIGPDGVQEWIDYAGPWTPLPVLDAAASIEVWLRLDVPTPLAAGAYGTSFSVLP